MKMIDTLARNPSIAIGSGLGSWLVRAMDLLDPVLQFILLLGSAVVVILTAIIKFREVMRKN